MPKVSVIIPTYNCGQYICQAIESVLKQTYKDWEIIVVDDGSTDDTYAKVKPYEKSGYITYIHQKNKGVAEARNAGILAATGEYIAYVDADDELDRRMIATCIDRVEKENSEWCVTDILRVFQSGNDMERAVAKTDIPEDNIIREILIKDFIRWRALFKKKTLMDIGPYDKTLLAREDWDMNIRLIHNNIPFSYIPEPLYFYKIRKNSLMKSRDRKSCDSTLRLLKKHHKKIADAGDREVAKIYAQHLWRLGKAYLTDTNDLKTSVVCIAESMRYDFSLRRLIHPFYFHIAKRFSQPNAQSK